MQGRRRYHGYEFEGWGMKDCPPEHKFKHMQNMVKNMKKTLRGLGRGMWANSLNYANRVSIASTGLILMETLQVEASSLDSFDIKERAVTERIDDLSTEVTFNFNWAAHTPHSVSGSDSRFYVTPENQLYALQRLETALEQMKERIRLENQLTSVDRPDPTVPTLTRRQKQNMSNKKGYHRRMDLVNKGDEEAKKLHEKRKKSWREASKRSYEKRKKKRSNI